MGRRPSNLTVLSLGLVMQEAARQLLLEMPDVLEVSLVSAFAFKRPFFGGCNRV